MLRQFVRYRTCVRQGEVLGVVTEWRPEKGDGRHDTGSDHSCVSPKCRMCGDKDETVWHVIGECSKLAGTEYKRRHDNVARIIHRALRIKYGFSTAERWYEHSPEKVLESREVKILWDFSVQTDHEIEARKPDIIVIDKTSRECHFIEITCSLD